MLIGTIRCSITSFQKDIGHDVGRIIDRCDIDKETLISNEKCPAANKRQRLAGRQGSQPEIRRVDIGRKDDLLEHALVNAVEPRESGELANETDEIIDVGLRLPRTRMVDMPEFQLQSRKRRSDFMGDPRCQDLLRLH
jgi:hypothetical protein